MTRRDKDPFDELFRRMLEDFFGGTGSDREMNSFFGDFDDILTGFGFDQEDFREAIDAKREYSSEQPFHFGFSIKQGPGGETEINTFGDDVEREEREPLVDVFEENGSLMVTAEIPGVEEDNIDIEVSDDELYINAYGEGENYSKEIELPSEVKEEPVFREYKNGVLSLRLEKK